MSGASITAEPPVAGAPPPVAESGRLRRYAVAGAFLAPAFVLLGAWIVYPAIYTIVRSFFDQSGNFAGIDNYKALFSPFSTNNVFVQAIKNNLIWVAVVPALITALGLIFAVLTEKVSWAVAFKTVVFMPMAISLFAAGVIWRIMDRQEPQLGTVNAFVQVFHDMFHPPGALSDAVPSTTNVSGSTTQGFVLRKPLGAGGVALLGVTAIPPTDVPKSAVQAVAPKADPHG